MEGLIPFLYRAIVQYKSGEQQPGWFCDSPSAATYMRLPGDSGRFGASKQISQIFRSEYNFSATASSPSSSGNNRNLGNNNNNNNVAATTQVIVETSVRSPVCRVKTLRAVA